MISWGKVSLVLGIVALIIPLSGKSGLFCGLFWVGIACGGMIYSVEEALVKNFD
ncbi:hypothetical protein Aconfl_28920 [Algoriphagus confluentis]|uniref:Uncharacterized protein n=1 Tax=Algoriphagus confluentis TaxID=1697556 RepID=A0ABQ6PQK7_9BACT|nr:hypothetical protein Aconfl_28920 [Algoriphagus confluentis]